MAIFAGLKVTIHPATIMVARSWTERLFTRPWRPFQRTRCVPNPLFTGGKCYQIGDTIIMTDLQYDALMKGMAHETGYLDQPPNGPVII